MVYSEINWYCDTDYMMNVWNKCGQKGTTLKDPNISEFVKPLLTVFDAAVKERKDQIGILQRVNNKEAVEESESTRGRTMEAGANQLHV